MKTELGHFWLTFDNGYTLNVFNGFGSYTENHYNIEQNTKIMEERDIFASWESKDCEIAIINPEGELCTNDYLLCSDTVKGYIDINELVDIINLVKNIEGDNNEGYIQI